jgi:hypothetical protein
MTSALNVIAGCDESEEPNQAFCFAGYIASEAEWQRVERHWRKVLGREELTEFKMADCVQGQGEFRDRERWPRERRDALQRELITVLASHELHGLVTAIDLVAYRAVAEGIKARRRAEKLKEAHQYWRAYFLAFQHQVELIAVHVGTEFPLAQKVTFRFDWQEEFQGRAQRLYADLMNDRSLDFTSRLGRLQFVDSKEGHVSVQAADLLAYEARRHVSGAVFRSMPSPERWQWFELRHPNPIIVRYFGDTSVKAYLRVLDDRLLKLGVSFDPASTL